MSLFLLSDLDTDSSGSSRHLRSVDYFAGAGYLGLKGQFHVVLDSLYYVDLWKKSIKIVCSGSKQKALSSPLRLSDCFVHVAQ